MVTMYEPPKFDESQLPDAPGGNSDVNDFTEKFLKLVGFGLLVAFIFPIYIPGFGKLVFVNFEVMSKSGVAGSLKFQMIYPIIAGVLVLMMAGKPRTQGKGIGLIAIGLFPFLLLFMSSDVQQAFSRVSRGMPGSGTMGIHTILSSLAVFGILSGAYASYVRPGRGNYGMVAAGGGGLYMVMLLVPQNGEIPLLAPFKLMFGRSIPGSGGMLFITGLVILAAIAVMVLASFKCLQMRNPHKDPRIQEESEDSMTRSFQTHRSGPGVNHQVLGKEVMKLWVAQFYIYGAYIVYIMIASPGTGMMGGSIFVMMVMGLIKFIPWFLGLYLLIPMGIAEIMLAGTEPPKKRVVV
ncbi:MAG: hypothetical protein GY940_47105 [bacterium]|nr:hypothetical protein [bacterium]